MPSMSLLSVGTASAMDMPHSVPLLQGHQPTPRAWYEPSGGWSRVGEGWAWLDSAGHLPVCLHRCTGPVSANTTPAVSTVSSVRTSIMTFPGILLRTATLTPVGVSETLGSVAWLCLVQTKCWLAKP